FVSNEELKKSFESFAEEHGEEPKATSHKNFAMFLGKHGCNPTKKREKRGWTGLRLRIPDNPNEGGDGVERGAF
ncbi:MAG: hypothetical protein EBR82_78600, partial [Caulobacteraceae bacterium]|nr:hypothetical protein [Caulobacteraceae bacterium]